MIEPKYVNYCSDCNMLTSNTYLEYSRDETGYFMLSIASGYVSYTEIKFSDEGVILRINADGNIEFLDLDKNLISSVYLPADSDGRGRYLHVCFKLCDNKIIVRFPEYSWIDNYPYCDGENDRWDAKIIGYKEPVAFDIPDKV